MIGSDVGGARSDGDGSSEGNQLPTGGSFSGESGDGKRGARLCPQGSGVRAGIAVAFIEADAGDETADVGSESDAEFYGLIVVDGDSSRNGIYAEDRARAGGTRRGSGSKSGIGGAAE